MDCFIMVLLPLDNETRSFWLSLDQIYPSQLYISQKKLDRILKSGSLDPALLPPIPIKKLRGKLVATDGHTRAVALYLQGYGKARVEWETEDLDWEMYEECVVWCEEEGIQSVCDLTQRIIPHDEYVVKWLKRCQIMQNLVLSRRKDLVLKVPKNQVEDN